MEIVQLLDQLQVDPWRKTVGFSPDIDAAQVTLFNGGASASDRAAALNDWLRLKQPCLFGRLAARAGAISYCILTEQDLCSGDDAVRARLRIAKLEWRRAAYKGDASALVLLACSSRLATALPDSTVELIAQQFSSLYLGTDVRTDVRYLDSVGLAIPGGSLEELYEFKAGVDYFSAHGDRRWWHDHRIPGGIAFSINSPGHLVRSGWLAGIAALSDEASGVPTELATVRRVVNSPEGALELAMRTIFTASNAVSGKATTLVPRDHTSPAAPACARDLPRDLSQADCSKYLAYYDTDWTLRTEFFRADVERPAGIEAREMDLTYFYDRSAANTDADLIEGVQVRHGAHVRPLRQRAATLEPRTVRLRDHPELAGLTE